MAYLTSIPVSCCFSNCLEYVCFLEIVGLSSDGYWETGGDGLYHYLLSESNGPLMAATMKD